MQVGLGLGQQRAHVLGARGALAQHRHDGARARQRFFVADVGEVAALDRLLRDGRVHVVASARGIAE